MKGPSARRGLWSPEPASTPVLVTLAVEAVVLAYLIEWYFMVTIDGSPPHHLVVNAYLMGALALAFLSWMVLRLRGCVTAATGAGFVVAANALFARIQGEFALYYIDVPWREDVFGAGGLAMLRLARYGGFVAFVFGLAMVAAACLSERVLSRRVRHSRA